MAREMAAAGVPAEEIIRRLMEQGVDHGVAVSVVFIRTSATNRPQVMSEGRDMIAGRQNEEGRMFAAFRRVRNRQLAAVIPALGALLLVLFGASDREAQFFGLAGENLAQIGLAVIVGVVIFSFLNYRCPACNAYLGRSFRPSYCRNCGARLN